ncbi:MAG TPA: methyl-accepting chemotaxis protein, partial [Thermoanaerobaculia bacterium]|nr:methyl-accepting chemotaxis protein [Thermoanaerobaculia bacterium]
MSEAESKNQALVGLLILGGVALLGLVLITAAEAAGAPGWLFNIYALLAAAVVALYISLVYRSQQSLRSRVGETLQRHEAVEKVLVEALSHLRSGDLVHCADQAQQLPGRLASTFATATGALDVLAQQIQSSSIEVATASNSVNQIASELASGSSEQAASVVEITAAMEELARTASQIAENAATQAELAQRADENGDAGAAAVEEAVQGVEEVRKRISGISTRADTLGVRSKEIYRVLDLITEIAQETHILSLNAAIEAAAAGEHGRRFSVVAEEVRRLAQRSQESVDSVRNLLDEFAGSIRATVVATEEGSKEATRVLERARAAASAIEDLRDASGDTARVAREISLATQQQNAASDEVVLTLKEVSQVVQRMADGLKQFTETADQLNEVGLIIQMLAQSFHLESPHSLKHMAELWAREVRRRLGSWEAIERLLEDLVKQQQYVECLYFYDGKANQAALTVNRQILGDRDVPA